MFKDNEIEANILRFLGLAPAWTEDIAHKFDMTMEGAEETLNALAENKYVKREDVGIRSLWSLTEVGKGFGKPKLKLAPAMNPEQLSLKVGDLGSWRANKAASMAAAKAQALVASQNQASFEEWLAALDQAEETYTMDANKPASPKQKF